MTPTTPTPEVQYLTRPGGRIAYVVDGTGPLVVAVPGMGDLRSTWDDLTGPLLAAGHRVAVLDLRGHGDSDTSFTEHGDTVTAADALALVEHLGGPAVLLGSSMGASSVALAAAQRPDLVAGLVLVAPILRQPDSNAPTRAAVQLLYRVLFARPWGAAAWSAYYRGPLNRGTHSPRLDAHVAAIRTSLRRPGHLRSFRDLVLQLDHRVVTDRLDDLARAAIPTIAFIGDRDPDYRDPTAELDWLATTVGARTVPVASCAHYPQHQRPDVVVPATTAFLAGLPQADDSWTVTSPTPRA